MTRLTIRGFDIRKGYLDAERQGRILTSVQSVVQAAPMFSPQTPFRKPMSVRMTSAGRYGWFSDASGYRYVDRHPRGTEWPAIPEPILAIWSELVPGPRRPDCCLINYYQDRARMGLHQDRDEADFSWPVVSVSLGDDGLFRIGNLTRGGKTESIWLESGDAVVMGGAARLTYHGVDRIRVGSSTLLTGGGRINLTMRVVD